VPLTHFIEGEERRQGTLLPEHLTDYVNEDDPVCVVDVFVDELDLASIDFARMLPAKTGQPAYHYAVLLKLYIHGYLNAFNRAGDSSVTRSVTSN